MGLWETPVRDVRPLLVEDRAALVSLLAGLSSPAWQAPTACPGWDVKDVALHLLQGDFGVLSRDRDDDTSSLLTGYDDYRAFVAALNAQNQRWVEATRALSGRVIRDLLEFVGPHLHEYWAAVSLDEPARVSWAASDPVPRWFDVAREFTERWVHQRQIRDAVGVPDAAHQAMLGAVIETFVWALPHHYRAVTGPDVDVSIAIEGAGGSAWTLARRHDRWDLIARRASHPAASVTITTDDAWRLFTGALDQPDRVRRDGDPALARHFLTARAIII